MKGLKSKSNLIYPITFYCFLTIVLVCILSIGFSSYMSQSSVEDIDISFRLQEDVRITRISVNSVSNNGESNYEEYNVSSINGSISLPSSSSTVTYEIDVTNIGNTKEGIYTINESYNGSNLEIKDISVNYGDALCVSSQCTLGVTKTILITIGYEAGGYNSSNVNHTFNLDFDFRRVFDITYINFNNIGGLPTSIISGETKNITFSSTNGIPLSVNVTNATANYTSPTLTLSNVTDNIEITGTFSGYTVVSDNTTTTYNHNTLTPNTDTTFNNIAGKPRVVVDANGKVISFEYTDTGSSGIAFAEGDSFDTGVDAFDSDGYTIHLKFKMDPYDNTGKMVLSAMKKTNGQKYAGFSFNVYSGSRFYLYANTNGANINQTAFGTLIGTFNVNSGEQTYDFDMTYTPTPSKGISITFTPSTSGSPYTATSNYLDYYPDSLEDTSIVLGGSVANHNKDIETMTILEFSVTKN